MRQSLLALSGVALAIALLPEIARGDDTVPPPADPASGGCGEGCPGAGVNIVAVEDEVHLSGRTLEAVIRTWNKQTARRDHIHPDHPRISFCKRCGSMDRAQSLTLDYKLDLRTPVWEAPTDLPDEDVAAIGRFVAAVQGHNNRHVANHRDALRAVVWEQLPIPEVEAAYKLACERAIAADNELDAKEGCLLATTSLQFESHPRTTCEPNWKPQDARVCWMR